MMSMSVTKVKNIGLLLLAADVIPFQRQREADRGGVRLEMSMMKHAISTLVLHGRKLCKNAHLSKVRFSMPD